MNRPPRPRTAPAVAPTPRPARAGALAGALVRWFRRGHRDLPWRRASDPYATWISEIMLQQTRVDVVVPYYERFLARFPTAHALAAAPLDDVLTAWAGLGYYRRARQLHAAAQVVVRDHGGRLPEAEAALRALPGIGRYTSGAILSIAFGRAAPIVDGNVARVLSRLYALPGGPGEPAWEKRLWTLAGQLVPAADPSAFNQGLMELGATTCTPRSPRCDACPLVRFCKAHAAGRPELYPPPKQRPKIERVERWALVSVRAKDGALYLRRRADDEHNAGQWEFPLVVPAPAGPPEGARMLGAIRHGILTRDYRIRAYAVGASAARRAAADAEAKAAWVARDRLAERPVTTVTRKILALLEPATRDE